jgi:hypothetical protein
MINQIHTRLIQKIYIQAQGHSLTPFKFNVWQILFYFLTKTVQNYRMTNQAIPTKLYLLTANYH